MDSAEKHNNCHQAYFEVRFPPGMESLFKHKWKKNFNYLKKLIFTKSLISIITIINNIRIMV